MNKKRGQAVFGMSFGMIFSIIIIIFIIAIAFYVIHYFLNLNTCTKAGTFENSFSNRIDKAYKASITQDTFEASVPNGVTYVCLGNISKGFSGNPTSGEEEAYDYLINYAPLDSNFFVYPAKKSCGVGLSYFKVPHMAVQNNGFFCEKVVDGKVSFGIKKGVSDAIPIVSN